MAENQYRTPQDVAANLDVSTSTLRRWSEEFAEFLSDGANSSQGKSHRRYTEQDISRLLTVRDYMNNGLTYEQVRQNLRESLEMPVGRAIMTNEAAADAVFDYISDTVENLRQGQQSVLNSQAANRELMGVVIQDNFNLKEENNRLRERMLELERQLGQIQREEASRREAMRQEFEMKLSEIREIAHQKETPITILQSRSGCLGSLFGGGSSRVETAAGSPSGQSGQRSPRPAQPRSYPRPPGPPE